MEKGRSLSAEECFKILRAWGVEVVIEAPFCQFFCELMPDGSLRINDEFCGLRFRPVGGGYGDEADM